MESGLLSFRRIEAIGVGETLFCIGLLYFLCINTGPMPTNKKTFLRVSSHTSRSAWQRPGEWYGVQLEIDIIILYLGTNTT